MVHSMSREQGWSEMRRVSVYFSHNFNSYHSQLADAMAHFFSFDKRNFIVEASTSSTPTTTYCTTCSCLGCLRHHYFLAGTEIFVVIKSPLKGFFQDWLFNKIEVHNFVRKKLTQLVPLSHHTHSIRLHTRYNCD